MWFEEEKAAAGTADGIRAEAAGREGRPGGAVEGHRHLCICQDLAHPGGGAIPGAVKAAWQSREEASPPPGPADRGSGQRARAEAGVEAAAGGATGSERAGGAAPPPLAAGGGSVEVLPVFLALPLNSSSAGVSHCLEMEWAGVCVRE